MKIGDRITIQPRQRWAPWEEVVKNIHMNDVLSFPPNPDRWRVVGISADAVEIKLIP